MMGEVRIEYEPDTDRSIASFDNGPGRKFLRLRDGETGRVIRFEETPKKLLEVGTKIEQGFASIGRPRKSGNPKPGFAGSSPKPGPSVDDGAFYGMSAEALTEAIRRMYRPK